MKVFLMSFIWVNSVFLYLRTDGLFNVWLVVTILTEILLIKDLNS